MQAETLSANVCVPFPCWVDFSAASSTGLQLTPTAKQCQKVPSKLVEEENAGGSVRREKKERCEIWDTVCRVWGWEGISCTGRLSGPSGCEDSGLGIATVWRPVALMARWFPARWGTGKRAPESHFGCQDSLSEPSLRWPDPKDLRGTRAGKTSAFLPKEEPREPVQLWAREFKGSQDQILSASHSPPLPTLYF